MRPYPAVKSQSRGWLARYYDSCRFREGGRRYTRSYPAVKSLPSGWLAKYYDSRRFRERGRRYTRPYPAVRYGQTRGECGRFGKSVFCVPNVLQAELGGWPYRHRSVSHYLCERFPAGVHLRYCLHCAQRRSECQGFQRPKRRPGVPLLGWYTVRYCGMFPVFRASCPRRRGA